jgi:hypothetical protein
MTCNTFNAPSSKYSETALTIEQLEYALLTFEQLNRFESDPAAKYDQKVLLENIDLTIQIFNQQANNNQAGDFSVLYPVLNDRILQGPITLSEYASFLDDSQLNINVVNSALTGGVTELAQISYFDQLNQYYNTNFAFTISNGFCSLFTGLLAQLSGLLSAGVKVINDLKNFSIDNVLAQLNQLKELIMQIIDQIVAEAINKIKNFSAKIVGFIDSAANVYMRKLQQIQRFFSEANIGVTKTKVEELIANMAGSYEDITSEILQYILFRLCQLTELLNDFMQKPLTDFAKAITEYETQKLYFANISNTAKLQAVQAGLYRPSYDQIIQTREQLTRNINASAQTGLEPKTYVTTAPTAEERALVNMLGETGNEFISFASSVLNMDDPYPGAGYFEVKSDVWIGIFRVARRMGRRFIINSGYRSPAYNASVGGATRSMHMSGLALDVNMTGVNRDLFIEYASQEGFTGIGTYSTFIHVDRRDGRSTWGDFNTEALALHRTDSFRRGS